MGEFQSPLHRRALSNCLQIHLTLLPPVMFQSPLHRRALSNKPKFAIDSSPTIGFQSPLHRRALSNFSHASITGATNCVSVSSSSESAQQLTCRTTGVSGTVVFQSPLHRRALSNLPERKDIVGRSVPFQSPLHRRALSNLLARHSTPSPPGRFSLLFIGERSATRAQGVDAPILQPFQSPLHRRALSNPCLRWSSLNAWQSFQSPLHRRALSNHTGNPIQRLSAHRVSVSSSSESAQQHREFGRRLVECQVRFQSPLHRRALSNRWALQGGFSFLVARGVSFSLLFIGERSATESRGRSGQGAGTVSVSSSSESAQQLVERDDVIQSKRWFQSPLHRRALSNNSTMTRLPAEGFRFQSPLHRRALSNERFHQHVLTLDTEFQSPLHRRALSNDAAAFAGGWDNAEFQSPLHRRALSNLSHRMCFARCLGWVSVSSSSESAQQQLGRVSADAEAVRSFSLLFIGERSATLGGYWYCPKLSIVSVSSSSESAQQLRHDDVLLS